MLKVIVVDDNQKRTEMLINEINKRGYGNRISLTSCETADQARIELKNLFDLMILDVVLPKKIGGTPQSLHSFNLLKDLHRLQSKYLKPNMIIGLTADIKDITNYRNEFGEHFITVTESSTDSVDWLNKIATTINGMLNNEQKIIANKTDKILITVHGIRTYGKWQKSLRDNVELFSKDFEYIDIKYGFFDLVSFSIPYLRMRRAEKAAKRLTLVLDQNHNKNIYIVAHSYGTLITSIAFKESSSSLKTKKTILCGSPLDHDTPIDHIVKKSEITINECGTSDIVLILARMFVIGMGDAGRVGFSRENSKEFLNRYHKGGHSLYFYDTPTPTFYEKFWIPMLCTDAEPVHVDSRRNFLGEDLIDLTVKIAGKIKPLLYFAIIGATFYFSK